MTELAKEYTDRKQMTHTVKHITRPDDEGSRREQILHELLYLLGKRKQA